MKIIVLLVLKISSTSEVPVILANASDVSHFSRFQRSSVKKILIILSRTLAKRTQPGQCQSVKHEEYQVHSYNRDGLCVLGFMDDHYPVRSVFALTQVQDNVGLNLITKVLDDYKKRFGDSWRNASADATEPWPYLNEALAKYHDPAEADKLYKLQQELVETKCTIVFYKQGKRTNQCCTVIRV